MFIFFNLFIFAFTCEFGLLWWHYLILSRSSQKFHWPVQDSTFNGQFHRWDTSAGNHGSWIYQPKMQSKIDDYNYHDSLQAHITIRHNCTGNHGSWIHQPKIQSKIGDYNYHDSLQEYLTIRHNCTGNHGSWIHQPKIQSKIDDYNYNDFLQARHIEGISH